MDQEVCRQAECQVIIVHIMKEHIDAAQIIGRGINLLTIILQTWIVLAYCLIEF